MMEDIKNGKYNFKKKSILIFLVGFFLILNLGFVSAFEFDNVGTYDEETKTIEIKNSVLGFDWWQLDTIAKITLESPLNYQVMRGEERLVAWYNLENFEEYDGREVFNVIDTYNVKNGNSPLSKNFKFKKKQVVLVEVPNYDEVCNIINTNGTESNSCNQILNGTKEVEQIEWKAFNKNDLLGVGNYTIGLFTEVEPGEKVEWIPTMYGVEIEEWAIWEESFNVDLEHYYYFEDNNDSVAGANDMTVENGQITFEAGKIGNAGRFGASKTMQVSRTGAWAFPVNTTINFWLWREVESWQAVFSAGAGIYAYHESGVTALSFIGFGTTVATGIPLNDDTWYMVTLTKNDTNLVAYVNAANRNSAAVGAAGGSGNMKIGSGTGLGAADWTGMIDEMGLWSRVLSTEEIENLYNGGTGITYTTDFNLIVSYNQPANYSNLTTAYNTVFNCSGVDDTSVLNLTLLMDDVVNETVFNSTANQNLTLKKTISNTGVGFHNWSCRVNNGLRIVTGETQFFNVTNDLNTTLNFPINYFNTTDQNITFNCSATDSIGVLNLTLVFDGADNETVFNSTAGENLSLQKDIAGLPDDNYNWSCRSNDGENINETTQRMVTVNADPPFITITRPLNPEGLGYEGLIQPVNWTITESSIDTIFLEYNGTNQTITGLINGTNIVLGKGPFNLTIWANDTLNNVNSSFIEWDYKIFLNNETYNASTYETETETYSIDVTANSSLTAANLIFDETSYVGTQDGSVWSRTLDMSSSGATNKSFNWSFTYDGDSITTNINNVSIEGANLSICGGEGGSVRFLNVTFLDEETGSRVNATADLVDWDYYLGSGGVTKNYLFTNTTENEEYNFCFTPPDKTIHNELTFRYASSGYPQRLHFANADLNNATTNSTLYLLFGDDGVYTTIQAATTVNSVIPGVTIEVERQFLGVWTLIGREDTDASGLATFWVNPDYNHRFTFTKTGYTTTQVIIRPTQLTYTQIMTSTSGEAIYNGSLEGLQWIFSPGTGITNATTYYFNVTSSQSNVVSCKFEIANSSHDVLATTSTGCSASGGSLVLNYVNTQNNRIFGRGYVDTGGGLLLVDGDAYWILFDVNVSTTETLKAFFETLKDINEFGEEVEQEYSRLVFFFLTLTILLGILTFITNWDVQNPGALIIFLWFIILFASFAGWFTFNGLVKESFLVPAAAIPFIDKYIYAVITGFFAWGYFINYWRRNS